MEEIKNIATPVKGVVADRVKAFEEYPSKQSDSDDDSESYSSDTQTTEDEQMQSEDDTSYKGKCLQYVTFDSLYHFFI